GKSTLLAVLRSPQKGREVAQEMLVRQGDAKVTGGHGGEDGLNGGATARDRGGRAQRIRSRACLVRGRPSSSCPREAGEGNRMWPGPKTASPGTTATCAVSSQYSARATESAGRNAAETPRRPPGGASSAVTSGKA